LFDRLCATFCGQESTLFRRLRCEKGAPSGQHSCINIENFFLEHHA
jgi:hypothetical protein